MQTFLGHKRPEISGASKGLSKKIIAFPVISLIIIGQNKQLNQKLTPTLWSEYCLNWPVFLVIFINLIKDWICVSFTDDEDSIIFCVPEDDDGVGGGVTGDDDGVGGGGDDDGVGGGVGGDDDRGEGEAPWIHFNRCLPYLPLSLVWESPLIVLIVIIVVFIQIIFLLQQGPKSE